MAPGLVSPQMPSAAPYSVSKTSSSHTAHHNHHYDGEISTETVESRQRYLGLRKMGSRSSSMANASSISNVVYSIKRRSSEELGSNISAQLLSATHESVLDWISAQRMSDLPPEGSSYDKVLAWAQLFVDRLHSFDHAVQEFAGDSYLAAQLAYGYCSLLLELGKENAGALMVSFGFFYSMSMPLVNLLECTELFSVSQETSEQLVMALSDLVTVVASVATYFHKAIRGLTNTSVSVNIYSTFAPQIKTFLERCEKTSESMWKHELQRENADIRKVAKLKAVSQWIAPEDHVMSSVFTSTSHLAHDREELTCLYIGTHLTRFLKSSQKTMVLSGSQGSGKTILASVILDYLQHPIGGITYNTLFVPIDARIPAETTSRAVAKSLLHQLFQKRTGNVKLLNILIETYERSIRFASDEDHDDILWKAVERAIGATTLGSKDLVMIIDGLDECSSGEDALYRRLQAVVTAKGASSVKLIALGAKPQQGVQNLEINEDLIFDDITAVVRDFFEDYDVFLSMDEMERETLIARIAILSKGSFVWAKQASKQIRHHSSSKNLFEALEKIEKCTVGDFVHRTLTSPEMTEQTRIMLAWLVTAERPLTIKELAALATINLDKQTINHDIKIDVMQTLKPVNSLVYMQDGLMYLRHGIVRKAVTSWLNAHKGFISDRHGDLATRLLVYINSTVTNQHECTLMPLPSHEVHQLTSRHTLLDFAIRYWPLHLRKSFAYIKPDIGDSEAAKLVAKVVPKNLTVVLLQAAMWQHRPTPTLLTCHTMMTNIARRTLTTSSPVTLQSIIFLANIYRQIDFTPEATTLFYEASTIANTLLTSKNKITMQICRSFVEITTGRTTTSKNDIIMTHREHVLQILVECYKAQYGHMSEYVVNTLKLLVEHYRMTKEETKIEQTITKIRTISGTTEFGASTSTTATDEDSRPEGDLHVHLRGRRGSQQSDQVVVLTLDIDEHDELIEGHAKYDFEFFLVKAERYLAEGRVELAEKTYIEIWQRVTREYATTRSALWEERKMKSVICYARFLTQQGRTSDASSILSTTWEEYKSSQASVSITETTCSMYMEMASMMKRVGLVSESLTLMKHCSNFYRGTNSTETSTYHELQQTIHSTSQELVQSMSSNSGSTTTTVSESMLEEMVLEQSSSTNTVDESTFTASSSLVRLYMKQHRLQDATRLLKKILRGVWPSLFTPNVEDVVAPQKLIEQCVDLAERLAECYHARRRRAKEEDMRVRVYRAMRTCRKVDDELRERVAAELVQLLRRTDQSELVITTRQEMLDDYVNHYGDKHPKVVEMLWELAELTRPRPIFVEYYQRIIKALHPHDADEIQPEAFEPFNIVATELWSKGRFPEAVNYYKVVFTCFLRQPKLSPKLNDPEFVKTLFQRYVHCLRSVRSDFTIIHKVSVDYRTQCKSVFGSTSSITIQATLYLAKVCQEFKRYEVDAIVLYEELLKIHSEEVDHSEICSILDSIYEAQADLITTTTNATTNMAVSSEQVQRVIKVFKKRVTTIRETHGWAHEESLSKMSEMVRFYNNQQTSSSSTLTQEEITRNTETVLSELKEATVHILSHETFPTRLIAAASTIASSYIQSNQTHKATEIKQELYRQVIMKDKTNVSSCGFDLSDRGRESLVFLAEFEHSLHPRHHSFTATDILAELTTQYMYFEEFRSLLQSTSSLGTIIASASRLHNFLASYERFDGSKRVFNELTSYFMSHEGKRFKLEKAQVHVLLHNLLYYFGTFTSQNFLRSVGISGICGVEKLLKEQKYDEAADLATATWTYISADDSYKTDPGMAKLVLILGLTLADGSGRKYLDVAASQALPGHTHHTFALQQSFSTAKDSSSQPTARPLAAPTAAVLAKPKPHDHSKLLAASAPITRQVLHVLSSMRISLSHISLVHLNNLISVLGAQHDHETLSWLLTILWESREAQGGSWPVGVTLALGRRYIVARYLVGDATAAVRLAEDIVYNCRRVHGAKHPRTLGMSVFLTKLYTGIAQKYHKVAAAAAAAGAKSSSSSSSNGGGVLNGGQDVAARYYKKSAAVHENILRAFSDPTFADMEGGLDGSMCLDDAPSSHGGINGGGGGSSNSVDGLGDVESMDGSSMQLASDGDRVKMHLRFLKLAVQRLGAWPKDYKEYERLNADVFREFGDYLHGVEGVERWNLNGFGGGKAESSEDMLNIEEFKHWELISGSGIMMQEEEEEEL
ncbi:hypothetical protein MCOR25_006296 [Pyricularia grisea]|nr:hypothetical protein MCOR25_006296 [Pyricularia grisea]